MPAELLRQWKEIQREGARLNAFAMQLKAADRSKKKGRKKKKAKPPKPFITKTVQYVYDPSDQTRLTAFYASPEWRMTRYEILRRDGAKCACCRTANKPVHVDHIKSLRTHWELRLNPNNLQVLCEDCNVGKGARHADDWR